jgi:hypothetical protein
LLLNVQNVPWRLDAFFKVFPRESSARVFHAPVVIHVLKLRSSLQMTGPNTRLVVASMKDVKWVGVSPMLDHPRELVRVDHDGLPVATERHLPVLVFACCGSPDTARLRAFELDHVAPESGPLSVRKRYELFHVIAACY